MRKYIRYVKKLAPFLAILLIIAASYGSAIFLYKKQRGKQQADYDSKVSALQKQISGLQDKLVELAKQSVPAALPTQEIVNREVARQKSQDELLTAAVSKVSPAVVSIVISKDIQQLQIAYVNPFGDDPFFKDFGFQVPVYQPSGETQRQKIGAGTGFLITSDGYILTNKHVVSDEQADYTVLLASGKQEAAKVIYKDPQNDVAIIKISGSKYPVVNLGNSDNLQLGQTIIAIGNALGEYNNSVSVGIISGLNRSIQATTSGGAVENLNGIIQTDAAINPGNSGGPLFDLNGSVLGINVAIAQRSNNIAFSIPINMVKSIIKNVLGK